jgi:hypothetical protein
MISNPSPFWGGVIQYCRDNKLSPDASKAVMEKAAKIAPHPLKKEFEKQAIEWNPFMWGTRDEGFFADAGDSAATNKKLDKQLYRQHGTGPAVRKAQGIPEYDINAPAVQIRSGAPKPNFTPTRSTGVGRATYKPTRDYWGSAEQNLGHIFRLAPAGIGGLGGYAMGGIADAAGYLTGTKFPKDMATELYRQGALGLADSARSGQVFNPEAWTDDYRQGTYGAQAQEYWNRKGGNLVYDRATNKVRGRITPHYVEDFNQSRQVGLTPDLKPTGQVGDTDSLSSDTDRAWRRELGNRGVGGYGGTGAEGFLRGVGESFVQPIPGAGTTNLLGRGALSLGRGAQAANVARATALATKARSMGDFVSAARYANHAAKLRAPGLLHGRSFLPTSLGGGVSTAASEAAGATKGVLSVGDAYARRLALSAAGGRGGYGAAPTVSAANRLRAGLGSGWRGLKAVGKPVSQLGYFGGGIRPITNKITGYTGDPHKSDPLGSYDIYGDTVWGRPDHADSLMTRFGSPEELATEMPAADLMQLAGRLEEKTNAQMAAGRFEQGEASTRTTQQMDFFRKTRKVQLGNYEAELTKQNIDPAQMRTHIYEVHLDALKTDIKLGTASAIRYQLYNDYLDKGIDYAARPEEFEALLSRHLETTASFYRDNPDMSPADPESFNKWRQAKSPLKVKPAAQPAAQAKPAGSPMEVRGAFKPVGLKKQSFTPSTITAGQHSFPDPGQKPEPRPTVAPPPQPEIELPTDAEPPMGATTVPTPTTPLGVPHDDPAAAATSDVPIGAVDAPAPTGEQPPAPPSPPRRPSALGEPAAVPGGEPVDDGARGRLRPTRSLPTDDLGPSFQIGNEIDPDRFNALTDAELNDAAAVSSRMQIAIRDLSDEDPAKHQYARSIVRIETIRSTKRLGLTPDKLPKYVEGRVASVIEGGITQDHLNEAIKLDPDAQAAWAAAQKTSDPVGAMKKWAGERTPMEWGMMAVGIPLALMGVMNMMSGEGGIGSVIMGILGIGLGLAGGGMFGAGPGQFAEQQGSSLMDMVGGLLGRNAPEAASDQQIQDAYGTPAQPGPLPHTLGSMGPNAPENRVGSAQPGAPAPPAAPAQPNAQAVAKAQRTKIYNFAQAFPELESFGSTPKETGLAGVFDSPEDVSALISSWANPTPFTTNNSEMQKYVSAIRKNPDMVKAIVTQLSTPESIAKFENPGLFGQGKVKRQQLIRALRGNYQLGAT